MNAELKQLTIEKIFRRYRQYQIISILLFVSLLILLGSFLWFLLILNKRLTAPGGDDIDGSIAFMLAASIAFASFVSVILLSLFKRNSLLANFWYSRALALDLYESESDVSLKDLVSSFASESIKFSLSSKSLAEMFSTLQGKDAQ